MAKTETLTGIAETNLDRIRSDYEDAGATVSVKKQADGTYDLTATIPEPTPGKLTFTLPSPAEADLGASITLWGTCYYGQPANESSGGITLRNKNDQVVGPAISQKDWCLGAMEGTIVVTASDGSVTTYNYNGTGTSPETSCRAYFPNISESVLAGTERARFQKARGPYGDGAGNYILSPYRTLAVDQNVLHLSTAFYIPQAKGVQISLPDGSTAAHDGYFFAADTGGLIKNNHVDFFLGVVTKNPFPFVQSTAAHTFPARIVTNAETVAALASYHK